MELDGGNFETAKGKADAPNMTITQAVADWREINAGRLNPQMAFMSGKIKVSGDMSLAMKLGSIMATDPSSCFVSKDPKRGPCRLALFFSLEGGRAYED